MSEIKIKDKSRSKNVVSEEVNRLISLVGNIDYNKETDLETWKHNNDGCR